MSEGQTAGVDQFSADLLWPGSYRTGRLMSAQSFVDAMVRVEAAWVGRDLPAVSAADLDPVAIEAGGNPVIPLVSLLRERTGDPDVHRGLTSQDVVDTALMLLAADAVAEIDTRLRALADTLVGLAGTHAVTVMAGRTLTQHAVPTTFGLKAATWLAGVLDAWDDVDQLVLPVQVGGAAGTNAAIVARGLDPDDERERMAATLGLAPAAPWHTTRRPVTRLGDAAAAVTDACARIANDVLVLSRPEIGEVAEGSPGGSSTMPHKQNPVLSVLVRRAALAAPQLAATLHLAAAGQVDERADGAWHAEWAALRDLLALAVVATAQTADLVAGLVVNADRMATTAESAQGSLLAENGGEGAPSDYLGEAVTLIDRHVVRAEKRLR